MKNKFVITIGRLYGSGGREVGIQLAKLLEIGFYDKRLISEAARISGLNSRILEQKDERVPGSLIHALSFGMGFSGQGFTQESLFRIQTEAIEQIAEKESCVIVGRCADYILRDNPRCFNIFVHAPADIRIRRIMNRHKIQRKEAVDMMQKIDKERAAYYDFYTDKRWGDSTSYHLAIDSSLLGIAKTVEYIRDFVMEAIEAGKR